MYLVQFSELADVRKVALSVTERFTAKPTLPVLLILIYGINGFVMG